MKSLSKVIIFIFILSCSTCITFFIGSGIRNKTVENLVFNNINNQFSSFTDNFHTQVWSKVGTQVVTEVTTNAADQKMFPIFKQYFDLFTKNIDFTLVTIKAANAQNIISSSTVEINNASISLIDNIVNFMIDRFNNNKAIENALYNKTADYSIIKSDIGYFYQIALPLSSPNNAPAAIIGYQDITGPWEFLVNFQIISALTIGLIITTILMVLGTYSMRLQTIIVEQIKTNTELEDAKQKAEESSMQKSQFLANMSHELRTPLNAIIGFSEIIKTEALGPIGVQQYKEYSNDIHTSGAHLLSIINDILDFSKAEANKLSVETIEVDVTKMAKQCFRIMHAKASEAKVILSDCTDDQHYTIYADPKRLKQVLLNVLSNSVKFTSENGTISIEFLKVEENKLQIILRDTGIGIEAKDIAKVLSPFEQVDNKHSRKYEGTGLGLPLSKKLVELMNGKFHIESEVGIGTTVKLTFDLANTL